MAAIPVKVHFKKERIFLVNHRQINTCRVPLMKRAHIFFTSCIIYWLPSHTAGTLRSSVVFQVHTQNAEGLLPNPKAGSKTLQWHSIKSKQQDQVLVTVFWRMWNFLAIFCICNPMYQVVYINYISKTFIFS